MNGVVLWSDASLHKAVIWCEDQGDLAFYTQQTHQDLVDLHEGDLICFDITLRQNTRMVENPQVLAEAACTGLAQSLAGTRSDIVEPNKGGDRNPDQVISFAARSKKKRHAGAARHNYIG